jgi:subtilisin family serine protease
MSSIMEPTNERENKDDLPYHQRIHRIRDKKIHFIALAFLIISFIATVSYVLHTRTAATNAIAQEAEKEVKPSTLFSSNEVLIKVKKQAKTKVKVGNVENTGLASLNKIGKELKIKKFEKATVESKKSATTNDIFQWYILTVDDSGQQIDGTFDKETKTLKSESKGKERYEELLRSLLSDPDIEVVEPNYIATSDQAEPSPTPQPFIPNDPYYLSKGTWGQVYDDMWGLKKINVEGAWAHTTGSASLVIADLDTGVDRNHPDIANNMWVNINEVESNGVDDDGNGYIDDYYGWDFVNRDNDPMDDAGHGTHTAGTIAAVGNNNAGVVGVSWSSKIMALKILNNVGGGPLTNAANALIYAADMEVKVSSNSYGCDCQSVIMEDAVKYAHDRGMTIVTSAGNNNIDALNHTPSSIERTMSVAATDFDDKKANYSNFGEKIDVAAPGGAILSLKASVSPDCTTLGIVGDIYCRMTGTSMSTPHVTGLVALLLSKDQSLSNEAIRQLVRRSADDVEQPGRDLLVGSGRINAKTTLDNTNTFFLAPFISAPKNRSLLTQGTTPVIGTVAGSTFSQYKVDIGSGRSPTSWTTLTTSTTPIENGVLASITTGDLPDGKYAVRVQATDTAQNVSEFQLFDVAVDNFDVSINSPTGFISKGNLEIHGNAIVKNALVFRNYILEWGVGESPTTWSTADIALTNSGTQTVNSGVLASWNTTSLNNNQVYSLRLTTYAQNGASEIKIVQTTIDENLVSGWPKVIPSNLTSDNKVAPVVADLDNDGTKEIIIVQTQLPSKVHVYRKDGSLFPNFPITIGSTNNFSLRWSVNVDDLDGDGKKEIVTTANNAIYIIKEDGTFYPGWPRGVFSRANLPYFDRTPVIVDLNRDGKKELVTMEADNSKLHALQLDGTYLPGFPVTTSFSNLLTNIDFYGSLSSTDMDNDGYPEIAFGYGRNMYLYDHTGTLLPGWPFTFPPSSLNPGANLVVMNPAAFADIDGNTQQELITIAQGYACACETYLYAFKKDGSVMQGYPVIGVGRVPDYTSRFVSPVGADINRDGKDEIIVGIDSIRVFGINGLVFKENTSNSPGAVSPALANVMGDGTLEVTSLYGPKVALLGNTGQTLWSRQFPVDGHNFSYPGVLSDLDNNGSAELIAARSPNVFIDTTLSLYVWEIPGNSSYEWPMFLQNSSRAGRLMVSPLPTPVVTATPTAIPTTTSTPIPTATPVPSVTPKPTPTDSILPTVSITAPKNGSQVRAGSTVSITATATDNVKVTKVEFSVNNVLICTDTTSKYSCSWVVPANKNVIYSLQAKAYDSSGNTKTHVVSVSTR